MNILRNNFAVIFLSFLSCNTFAMKQDLAPELSKRKKKAQAAEIRATIEVEQKHKLFLACMNKALEKFGNKDCKAFDMSCGDNACQVRAHKLFCMLEDNKELAPGEYDSNFLTRCFFGKEFGGLETETEKLGKFVKVSGCDAMSVKKLRKLGKENTDMCMEMSLEHLLDLAKIVLDKSKGNQLESLVIDLQESLKQVEGRFDSDRKIEVNPKSCSTISTMMLIFLDLLARDKVVCLQCTNICEGGVFAGQNGKTFRIAKTEKNLFFRPNKEKTDFEIMPQEEVLKLSEKMPVFVVHGLVFRSPDEGRSTLDNLMSFFERMGFEKGQDQQAIKSLSICCKSECPDCSTFVERIKKASLLNDIIFPNAAGHKQFPDSSKHIKFGGQEFFRGGQIVEMREIPVLKKKFEEFEQKPGVSRDDMSLFLIDHVFVSLKKDI